MGGGILRKSAFQAATREGGSIMATTLSVGDMTVYRIVDFEGRFIPIRDLLPALTQEMLEENRHWQPAGSLDADDCALISVHSYIVKTPHHTIMIDTCLGNDKPRANAAWSMRTDTSYLQALAAAGIALEDIDYVMCTHLHIDHVGWNTRLIDGKFVPTFPNARYIFAAEEHDYWRDADKTAPNPIYQDSVLPVVELGLADLVGYDFQLGDHLRILPTPGHTVGHVAFCLGKKEDELVFSGDLMHAPIQTRFPHLNYARDAVPELAAATRRSFLERYCDTKTLCCTAHFPAPSVGRIRRWDEGFKCESIDLPGF
jgi:glyoxylase-like metal-dependent hydrolase (beta-lactamase superfamily II)